MHSIRDAFTKWYYKRGYRFDYTLDRTLLIFKGVFTCPFWVRPLLIFFSPSVYYWCEGQQLVAWIREGMDSVQKTLYDVVLKGEKTNED